MCLLYLTCLFLTVITIKYAFLINYSFVRFPLSAFLKGSLVDELETSCGQQKRENIEVKFHLLVAILSKILMLDAAFLQLILIVLFDHVVNIELIWQTAITN